jgi:glycosyltransferase involved in cell wall biosynthesis
MLYLTSSTNPNTSVGTAAQYREIVPFGHGQVLFRLEQLGWQTQRLGFRDAWNPSRVARNMDACDPAIVLTNGTIGLHPVLARRFLCRWRGPIVATWDDFYEVIWRVNWGWLAGLFMRWFERQIIMRSDYVITISLYNKSRAESWGKKTWYIPNGCDVPEFDSAKCDVRLDGKMNLVYCGDQNPYKRAGDIVKAMAFVPPEIKLYLIGAPNPRLQKHASANVTFLGRRSENDKWAIMSQSDVLVCTADTDCNAKFHEYLRMRKPILAYDGIPNCLFRNRVNALLTRDYPAAIMELCGSPELRQKLAENAARDIPVYTWREIAQQYDDAFREIVRLYGDNG